MRRPRTLLAAAVAAVALLPSAASAATVELVDGTVVFTAAPGERNAVSSGTRVLGPPLRLGIVDAGEPLTVGTGCTALDAHTAVCGDETTAPSLPMVLELGDGDDTLFHEDVVGSRELTVHGGGGADAIRVGSGTGFDPLVYGGPGDDTLTANMNVSGAPVLLGGRGDDLLRNIGGSGALLDGGRDDDTYVYTLTGASTIVPGPGFDTLDHAVRLDGVDFAFGSCPRCVEQAIGSAFADVLTGDDRDQSIRGGDGDDAVTGGGGADVLAGEGGDDAIDARDGTTDAVSCGDGVDHVLADRRDKVSGDCEDVSWARGPG